MINSLFQYTNNEKGAIALRSTGDQVVDFFLVAGAYRVGNARPWNPAASGDYTLENLFDAAYLQNPVLTVALTAYIRSPRGGVGERDVFRRLFEHMRINYRDAFVLLAKYVPTFGRWDDLLIFPYDQDVVHIVREQINQDLERLAEPNAAVSLLGKWMPSESAGKTTSQLAKIWAANLDMSPANYRLALSALRKRINVVERLMSANRWGEINYEQVPSRAMFIYGREAFRRHDRERFEAYLNSVKKGEAQIKAGTLFPHEIVYRLITLEDETAEVQWQALPNYVKTPCLPLIDVSGSMFPARNLMGPIHVALGLGIYMAQRLPPPFTNRFMTFSTEPGLFELDPRDSLRDQIQKVIRSGTKSSFFGGTTDFIKAIRLIVEVAKRHNVPQNEIPPLIVLSDMEFDPAQAGACLNLAAHDQIKAVFAEAGYAPPKMIWWRIAMSGTRSFPARVEKDSIFLTGMSPAALAIAQSGGDMYTGFETALAVANLLDLYNEAQTLLTNGRG